MSLREETWKLFLVFDNTDDPKTSDEEFDLYEKGANQVRNSINDSDDYLVFEDTDGNLRAIRKVLILRMLLEKEV